MDDHGPMDEAIREQGSQIGGLIASALPPTWGFALLLFPFDEGGGRMNYISNAPRDDMMVALRELVAKMEGGNA